MSDIAAALAGERQLTDPSRRYSFPLAIVTGFANANVTVTFAGQTLTVPRLRSYTTPQINDTVVLARSGGSVYCLGALNSGPVPPPTDPPVIPDPPPGPGQLTATFHATFTGNMIAGGSPINTNPDFANDLTGWEMPGGGALTWMSDGWAVVDGDQAHGTEFRTYPLVASAATDYWIRIVGRVGVLPDPDNLPIYVDLLQSATATPAPDTGTVPFGQIDTLGAFVFNNHVTTGPLGAYKGARLWVTAGSAIRLDWFGIYTAAPNQWSGPTADLQQGTAPNMPPAQGAVFYGGAPATIGGGVALGASVRIQRVPGGTPNAQQPSLYLVKESAPPDAGPPTTVLGPITGPAMVVGQSAAINLPAAWGQALLDGSAGGLMLQSLGAPAVRFAGQSSWIPAWDLTITYQPSIVRK
jgi:hypothetical protein